MLFCKKKTHQGFLPNESSRSASKAVTDLKDQLRERDGKIPIMLSRRLFIPRFFEFFSPKFSIYFLLSFERVQDSWAFILQKEFIMPMRYGVFHSLIQKITSVLALQRPPIFPDFIYASRRKVPNLRTYHLRCITGAHSLAHNEIMGVKESRGNLQRNVRCPDVKLLSISFLSYPLHVAM